MCCAAISISMTGNVAYSCSEAEVAFKIFFFSDFDMLQEEMMSGSKQLTITGCHN